jgi:hypothetical protein
MKKYAPLLVAAAVLFLSSCADEDAAEPFADDREKFLGDWTCQEQPTTTTPFTITIDPLGSGDSVYISNFSGYGSTAVAVAIVDGKNLTIPAQQIGATNIDILGSGIYSSNGGGEKITMNYSADGQSISAVCTRQ